MRELGQFGDAYQELPSEPKQVQEGAANVSVEDKQSGGGVMLGLWVGWPYTGKSVYMCDTALAGYFGAPYVVEVDDRALPHKQVDILRQGGLVHLPFSGMARLSGRKQ